MFVTDKLGSLTIYPARNTHSKSKPEVIWYTSQLHWLYVDKFLFDASYEAKYTINNQKLVQFTFNHAIVADKKRKRCSNRHKKSVWISTIIHGVSEKCATFIFTITSANVDHFYIFFHY